MRRIRPALIVLGLGLGLAIGCSGNAPPTALPTETESSTRSVKPSATATPSKTPSATPSPTPPPSTPVGLSGAYFAAAADPTPVDATNDCAQVFPELLDVSCDEITLDGGSLVWVAGTADRGDGTRAWTMRVLTFDRGAGGYVLRYEASDPTGAWTGFRAGAGRLTGHGVDGFVVQVLRAGEPPRRGYDVFTWRKGGPLVLRGHRTEIADLRLALSGTAIEEYEAIGGSPPSAYIHRRLTWDGRQFRVARLGTVPPDKVPAAP